MSLLSELLKTEKIPESGIDYILVYKNNFKSSDPRTARQFQNFLVLVRSGSRFLNSYVKSQGYAATITGLSIVGSGIF